MIDPDDKDIAESINRLRDMPLDRVARERGVELLQAVAAAQSTGALDRPLSTLLELLQAGLLAVPSPAPISLFAENPTGGDGLRRLQILFEALVRHFDVLAGESRDSRWFRDQLESMQTPAQFEVMLEEMESRLLACDGQLSRERDRDEKALGYLQRQCEDLASATGGLGQILEDGVQSLGLLADELSQNSSAKETALRRATRDREAFAAGRAEVDRIADRLSILERKLNELRSGVRNRSDLVFKDDWTGLYRDDGFQLRAAELFARWQRARAPLSAVVVSVDIAEDQPLTPLARHEMMRQVAAELERRVRVSDLIGVTDSDRFTLLLPDTNLEGCHAFASRMVVALETAGFTQLGSQLRVAVVAGITAAVEGDSLNSLLSRASEARDVALNKGVCCEALA